MGDLKIITRRLFYETTTPAEYSAKNNTSMSTLKSSPYDDLEKSIIIHCWSKTFTITHTIQYDDWTLFIDRRRNSHKSPYHRFQIPTQHSSGKQ